MRYPDFLIATVCEGCAMRNFVLCPAFVVLLVFTQSESIAQDKHQPYAKIEAHQAELAAKLIRPASIIWPPAGIFTLFAVAVVSFELTEGAFGPVGRTVSREDMKRDFQELIRVHCDGLRREHSTWDYCP